jgi:hypothetical protein
MYIGGEGGTGNPQVIKAIIAAIMTFLKRDREIILKAPTGAATLLWK